MTLTPNLGANVEDDHDHNLGIHLYVDGASTDAVQLDTSVAGQHTIDYVATDTSDLTSTSTRIVIVSAVNDNPPPSDNTATSTGTN